MGLHLTNQDMSSPISIIITNIYDHHQCDLPFEILVVSFVIFVQFEQVFSQCLWPRELILLIVIYTMIMLMMIMPMVILCVVMIIDDYLTT